MRITLRATNEYNIYNIKNSSHCLLTEGDVLCEAIKTTQEDYEYNRANNECYKFIGCAKTAKGALFVWWVDLEFNQDYISVLR